MTSVERYIFYSLMITYYALNHTWLTREFNSLKTFSVDSTK